MLINHPLFWFGVTGAAPQPETDTHDGGTYSRREFDELRKRIRRAEEARERSDQTRRKAEKRLADSIEHAYRRIVEGVADPVETVNEIVERTRIPVRESDGAMPFVPDFRALAKDLEAAARLVALMEEIASDEEDVEILMLAM